MNKWMIIPALAGAVTVGGVALANDSSTDVASDANEMLTLKEAKELAIDQYGGKVTEIELEKKKSGYVYDVEVKSNGIEYDLDIDAITGEIELEKQSKDKQSVTKTDAEAQDLKVVDSPKSTATNGKMLTADQAVAIAQKKARGTVTKVKVDTDDGRKHYDIEIKDGTYEYDFEIDAYTGDIIEYEKEFDDDKKQSNSKVNETNKTMLTEDQAIAIAMKNAKGHVTEIELDYEDGRKVYEIEIEDGKYEYDFEIDAMTGEIVKFEKDRDDD
ncbi:PepSY domain-containing protein [Sporosarcina contaminans]|uniref:PepSY domain-containing protein n=1 Tax=Sporosarcina contaminans TaxID=633403 RepID=A0ABW3U3N5_9BACL